MRQSTGCVKKAGCDIASQSQWDTPKEDPEQFADGDELSESEDESDRQQGKGPCATK